MTAFRTEHETLGADGTGRDLTGTSTPPGRRPSIEDRSHHHAFRVALRTRRCGGTRRPLSTLTRSWGCGACRRAPSQSFSTVCGPHTASGIKTWEHFLRPLYDRLRQMQAPTLEMLHDPAAFETLVRGSSTRGVVRRMLTWLGGFGATSDSNARR